MAAFSGCQGSRATEVTEGVGHYMHLRCLWKVVDLLIIVFVNFIHSFSFDIYLLSIVSCTCNPHCTSYVQEKFPRGPLLDEICRIMNGTNDKLESASYFNTMGRHRTEIDPRYKKAREGLF